MRACSVLLVAWSALSYLTTPVSAWLIEWHWGDYSLLGDTWSAAFLLLAGIAGVFISIYALDYGKGYMYAHDYKDKLTAMSEDEQLTLLATDGMLVKRPLLVGEDFVLTGFRATEWEARLG